MLTNEEKKILLKAFTNLSKKLHGRGPQNLFIKDYGSEFHLIVHGILSEYKKHIINEFGDEAVDVLTRFYVKDLKYIESSYMGMLDHQYIFKVYDVETDFYKDIFHYKIKFV